MNTNTIEVTLTGTEQAVVAPEIRWNQDIVQFLKINGITLPAQYQVDFANVGDAETITMIGDENGVQIPDQLISTGIPICAYLYLQTGDTSWNTQVKILINVIDRPDRSDIQPTPSEQSTIDSLISAMNNIVREGVGIPAGGTVGQVLTKSSATDYDAEWTDQSGPSGEDLYVVHITRDGNYYTSDRTAAEIYTEANAGKLVVAVADSEIYTLQSYYSTGYAFIRMTGTSSGYTVTRLYSNSSNPNRVNKDVSYGNSAPSPSTRSHCIWIEDDGQGGYGIGYFYVSDYWDVQDVVLTYKTISDDPICADVYDTYREFQLVKRWMTGWMNPETAYNVFTAHYLFQQIYNGKLCQFELEGGLESQDFSDWTVTYTETAI